MNLYETYEDILNNKIRWNPTIRDMEFDIEQNINTIFSKPNSYNFVFSLFWKDANYISLLSVLNTYKNEILESRLRHTNSLYLLGILLAEKIGFNRFDLMQWDTNNRRDFLHSWVGICLFHDFGYFIENNKEKYNPHNFSSIDDICDAFNIKYDLRKEYTETLIDDYYKYLINSNHIDHGIVGAMMLYNSLMARNNQHKEFSKGGGSIISEKPLFGKKNEESIAKYAYTIARHNMWFAKPEDVDIYKALNLNQLIPKDDNSHRISFSKDPLLFLLCLIDTLEPLKTYDEESDYEILKSISFDVFCSNDTVSIKIEDLCGKIINKVRKCTSWLDIEVDIKSDKKCIISLKLPN